MSHNTPPQQPAIVLTTVRHKDGVSIVRVFSREHGIVGCLVREGVKGSRRSRNLYAPLSLLDLVGLRLIKDELFKFDRAERMLAQDLTTGEIPRGALAMFLAEFILRTLDSGTPHSDLFDALWRTTHARRMLSAAMMSFPRLALQWSRLSTLRPPQRRRRSLPC